MKFTQTGTFKKDFLKEPVIMNPMERAGSILLETLNYFVGFVAKERPEIIADYVQNLAQKYQGLAEGDFLEDSSGEIEKICAKFENSSLYITHYHIDHPSPDRDQFVSLEKMLENRLSGDTTLSRATHIVLACYMTLELIMICVIPPKSSGIILSQEKSSQEIL